MSSLSNIINPFYAARLQRRIVPATAIKQLRFAKLPRVPLNASPVPHLTSLYHFDRAGEYGDRRYPGNCGGNLIKDLLRYYRPSRVFDPMSGSGTCREVCLELAIECVAGDIHNGFDLCEPSEFSGPTARIAPESFDFVWIHPPYWRQKLYADDPRDLSRCPTLDSFLERYALAIAHCGAVLKPGGILAVLMGDYQDRAAGFVPLVYHTKRLAFECDLRQQATDIIRFSHGASSGKKVYRSSFIPGLHDVCMLFEKPRQSTTTAQM
jgi:SAM-dependent methyltransferase